MATPKQESSRQLYAKLMTEVKVRIRAINSVVNVPVPIPPPLVREFCYLQMRMICELVALACLVAHGDDIKEVQSLKGEYNAHRIIDSMSRLHPDFFPKAVREKKRKERSHIHFDDGPNITKEDLIKLYHECDNVLHKGKLKKLLAEKSPVQVHFPDIAKKAQMLCDLLGVHAVKMIGDQKVLICVLETSDTGQLQVVVGEAMTPPTSFWASEGASR